VPGGQFGSGRLAFAVRPSVAVIQRLGRRPEAGVRADHWDDAAGRIDQHHAAFGPEERSGVTGQDAACRASCREMAHAIEAFNQPLSRAPVLQRGLGLEL
jgi:hypothetical protein